MHLRSVFVVFQVLLIAETTSEGFQAFICKQQIAHLTCTNGNNVFVTSIDVIKTSPRCNESSNQAQCCTYDKEKDTLIKRICWPTDKDTIGEIFQIISLCHTLRPSCLIPNNHLKTPYHDADLMTFHFECTEGDGGGSKTSIETLSSTSTASPQLSSASPFSSSESTVSSISSPQSPARTTSKQRFITLQAPLATRSQSSKMQPTSVTTQGSKLPKMSFTKRYLSIPTTLFTKEGSTTFPTKTITKQSSRTMSFTGVPPVTKGLTSSSQVSVTMPRSTTPSATQELASLPQSFGTSKSNVNATVSSTTDDTLVKTFQTDSYSSQSHMTKPMASKIVNVTNKHVFEGLNHAAIVPGLQAVVAMCVLGVLVAIGIATSMLIRSHLKGKYAVYPKIDVHDDNHPHRIPHGYRQLLPRQF